MRPPRKKEFRLVVWGMYIIYGSVRIISETFGLIETAEKAARMHMLTAHLARINIIKNNQTVELAEYFGVKYRIDFLNLL